MMIRAFTENRRANRSFILKTLRPISSPTLYSSKDAGEAGSIVVLSFSLATADSETSPPAPLLEVSRRGGRAEPLS
jgi:hypothetical protein